MLTVHFREFTPLSAAKYNYPCTPDIALYPWGPSRQAVLFVIAWLESWIVFVKPKPDSLVSGKPDWLYISFFFLFFLGGWVGIFIAISCLPYFVSWFCPDDVIVLTAQPFVTKLVRLCITVSRSVMQRKLFDLFTVKATMADWTIQIWVFFPGIFWIADSFAIKPSQMVHHHKPECTVNKLDCCVRGQGSQRKFKISTYVGLGDIFWTA